ncbi:MAG TPA: hypothetical protein PL143_00080 [Rhodocyclaceae bacterium]|nr:hypothetical protein [Rhodocyclaceae bacterium]
MTFKFHFHCQEDWPGQSWLARLPPGAHAIDVWCGPAVECADSWFCEAIWDGAFGDGAFDETDIVAGTGARIRNDRVVFVSSGSTVDRLQWATQGGVTLVSNSLACLGSHLASAALPAYPHYLRDFYSVVRGIRRYRPQLPLVGATVELVYFDNLEWAGGQLVRMPKPHAERRFEAFDDYHDFLKRSLQGVVDNMSDGRRARSYSLLGTLSTGYDSTTVTALAQPLGLDEVICFERQSGRDRGSEIAHYFGVTPISVSIGAWRKGSLVEVPFIAGDAFGEEVHYAGAADKLSHRVLLTGYHGDKVWDQDTPYLSPDLVRGDLSGLALTEYRLGAGFMNCPIPFWGARSIRDISRISRSEAMKPWRRSGDYSRPICRRIVESSGVPGDAFGRVKSYASQWFALGRLGLSETSLIDYLDYLHSHRSEFIRRGRIPPTMAARWSKLITTGSHALAGGLMRTPAFFRAGLQHLPVLSGLIGLRTPNPPHPPMVLGFPRYLFPWALEHAMRRYQRVF